MVEVRDQRTDRWGGLAGIAGGVLLVVVFAIVGILVGPEPDGPAGAIARFPEVRVARTVENGLYLLALLLWVPLALALADRLRRTAAAAALFGAGLHLVGLTIVAAGAIPHAVTSGLSDRYHAAGVTTADQATLVQLWHATQGLFEALLLTGLLVMPAGVVLFGVAMRRDPAFGRVTGTACVLLGGIGLGAAVVMLADPGSPAAAAGVFALLGFHAVAGWRLLRTTAPAGLLSPA
ncbi:hypothetical protein AB0K00_10890 [Dactylosporangium sp. NPDC049525]|uniref:hypothetical protein n=1 Tax=Dactylosporangium sp. NPDC049525 TaxID=3154730 RepID=UPI003439B340